MRLLSGEGADRRTGQARTSYIVIAAVAVITIAVVGYFIFEASRPKPLTQLETTLFAVLIAALQIWLGYLVGHASARRAFQPFVRSAVRRSRGISAGLSRAQGTLDAALEQTLDSDTLLAVIYATRIQLGELAPQASAGEADWGEFSEEAEQALMQIEAERGARIDKLAHDLTQLDQLRRTHASKDEGGQWTEPVRSSVEAKLGTLAQQIEAQLNELSGALDARPILPPAYLVASGRFRDAVASFDKMITVNPSDTGLYIGRARARYGAGDLDGALADLQLASELRPGDDAVDRMREQMIQGTFIPSLPRQAPFLEPSSRLFAAISNGDVERAKTALAEVLAAGVNPGYSAMDRAMVHVLAGECREAMETIDSFDLSSAGPFMLVQILSLKALGAACDGAVPFLGDLRDALDACGRFDLDKSPLANLEQGLTRRGTLTDGQQSVFEVLRHG